MDDGGFCHPRLGLDVKFIPREPVRRFRVGSQAEIEISDCGNVHLEPDELVTFVTPSGKEYDFVAKSWGFYATPSLNGRLAAQGFRTALVCNASSKRHFVMVVEQESIGEFDEYLASTGQTVVEWLHER